IDENPCVIVTKMAVSLTQSFAHLDVYISTIYTFMPTECNLSIKQAQFQSEEETIQQKRYNWVQNGSKLTTNLCLS
ncbi:hypothetical protein BD408DRAFT_348892, partial [Parasitella parasitica]